MTMTGAIIATLVVVAAFYGIIFFATRKIREDFGDDEAGED